jgi:hypothetical protein
MSWRLTSTASEEARFRKSTMATSGRAERLTNDYTAVFRRAPALGFGCVPAHHAERPVHLEANDEATLRSALGRFTFEPRQTANGSVNPARTSTTETGLSRFNQSGIGVELDRKRLEDRLATTHIHFDPNLGTARQTAS